MDTDGRTRYRRYGSRWLASWVALVLACTAVAAAAGTSSAASKADIEGVWSFNGGEIAVQPEGNGDFEGVVVEPTLFASCTHPAGQKIWKEIAPQADGSYWGFHQWYKTESCVENPELGPTAWRVLTETNGSQFLRVCLSSPGTSQPTIAPGSAGSSASYGCQSSSLTAPLASSRVGAFKDVVSLPSARKCLSVRRFAVHIRDPRYDPFKTVIVTLRGHKVGVVLHGHVYVATINLKGLPRGVFTVAIKATTFRGNRVAGSRRYHTCAKKPLRKPKHKHTTARGK